DRAGADPGGGELLVGELAVRRRRRVDDEAARVADVREVAPERQRLDEALARLAAAGEVEREDRAGAARQVLARQRTRRRVTHGGHLRPALEELRHPERVRDV